ncbi:hypothetical protein Dsin_024858, partial [Dipteronia sinensis]
HDEPSPALCITYPSYPIPRLPCFWSPPESAAAAKQVPNQQTQRPLTHQPRR